MTTAHVTLPAKDVARILRTHLRRVWPGTKPSVRMSRGTAYGNLSVSWTDGPTPREAEKDCEWACGEDFDGMTDMSVCRPSAAAVQVAPSVEVAEAVARAAGGLEVPVRVGSGLLLYRRSISPAASERVAELLSEALGIPVERDAAGNLSSIPSDAIAAHPRLEHLLMRDWQGLVYAVASRTPLYDLDTLTVEDLDI